MSKDDYQAQVLLFKVLSNEVRLKLIEALRGGEKSVGELCEKVKEQQTRVSHELRCLVVCGFADYRREGKWIFYSLNKKTVLPILEAADRHVEKFGHRMKGCEMVSEAKKMVIQEFVGV
ncbi:MAG: metalloregulator ArsR/SmtB family transcription factor [Thaumarchaeota archaeon]|nr:metalloregulator ArsR/SmtB family transcription factor [Nitrososphaerota archaeon]